MTIRPKEGGLSYSPRRDIRHIYGSLVKTAIRVCENILGDDGEAIQRLGAIAVATSEMINAAFTEEQGKVITIQKKYYNTVSEYPREFSLFSEVMMMAITLRFIAGVREERCSEGMSSERKVEQALGTGLTLMFLPDDLEEQVTRALRLSGQWADEVFDAGAVFEQVLDSD